MINLDVQDASQASKSWKNKAFCSICIGYIGFYFVTSSFTSSTSQTIYKNLLHLTDTASTLLIFLMALANLIGYIVSGILSDKYNPAYIITFGLIATGALNICFGLLPQSLALYFWPLHVFFCTFGYISCICLLVRWYAKSRLGVMWSIWFASYSIVTIITPICVSSGYLRFINQQISLLLSGLIAIIIGMFIFFNRTKSASDIQESSLEEKIKTDKPLSRAKIFFNEVFRNGYFWLLLFSCIVLVVVRFFITNWLVMYLRESGVQILLIKAHEYNLLFKIGGVLGVLFAGVMLDNFSPNHRLKVSGLFGFGIIFCTFIFWLLPSLTTSFLGTALMFSMGFFISALQILIFITIAKWSPKQVLGIVIGFVMILTNAAPMLSNTVFGRLVDNVGWRYCFLVLCGCAVLATFVYWIPLLQGWHNNSSKKLFNTSNN